MTLHLPMTLENSRLIYTLPMALTFKMVIGSAMTGESPAELMTMLTSPKEAAN